MLIAPGYDEGALEVLQAKKNLRLLVGEEGPGIPRGEGLGTIAIPTEGVESLNATVAASIALYCWSARQKACG